MNIYVDNLADEVNEDDLRRIFEAFGLVESVNILRDRRSGESKGYGFLEMLSTDEVQTAISEADGMVLKGKTIKVDEAHRCHVADSLQDSLRRGRPLGGERNRRVTGHTGADPVDNTPKL